MFGFAWPEISWFGLTLAVGAIMWATQVGPNEAVSNLSEWARKCGIQDPPSWLRAKTTDRRVRRSAAVILIILIFIGGIGFDRWLYPVVHQTPPPAQPARSERTSLQPADAAKINDALTRIHGIIKSKLKRSIDQYRSRVSPINGVDLSDATFDVLKSSVRDINNDETEISETVEGLNDAYLVQYVRKIVKSDRFYIVDGGFQVQMQNFIDTIEATRQLYAQLPRSTVPPDSVLIYSIRMITKTMNDYNQWADETLRDIETEQRNLRK